MNCGSSLASTQMKNAHPVDPDLVTVNNAWPSLPDAMKTGIVAMVKAAGRDS